MPSVTFNKKYLLKLIGRKLDDKKLEHAISMIGTDLKEMKGNEILVEVFPNRPDMLSEEGMARVLRSFLCIKTGLIRYNVCKSNFKFSVGGKIKQVRPYCAAAVVKGLRLNSESVASLMQLQEKLHITHGRNRKKVALGLHDLSKIEFPLKYTTVKRDMRIIPLDYKDEMSLEDVLKVHPKGKEFADLLEGFDEFPVWVDKKNNIFSFPPIINSEMTRVTEKTKDIFLDVTGNDEKAVEQALNILVAVLADLGGKIYSVNSYPNMNPWKMKLDLNKVNKLIGLNFNKNDVKRLLERMGYGIEGNNVLIPSYRTNIIHVNDIIEDIAIAYGFDNFKESLPNVFTIGEESKISSFKDKVSEIMIGFGLNEVSTFHILSNEDVEKIDKNYVKIKNPFSVDYNCLRNGLLASLMNVLGNNKHNEYPQRIFEIGKIFRDLNEVNILSYMSSHMGANFTEAKQVLMTLVNTLNLDFKLTELENNIFINGRSANIIVNNVHVGVIGEIHPELLEKFCLEMPVCCFEIDIDKIFNLLNKR